MDEAEVAAMDYTTEQAHNVGALDMDTDGETAVYTPEPFEPDERVAAISTPEPEPNAASLVMGSTGAVKKAPAYPAEDIRKSRREERLKKKAVMEDKVAHMITESALKVEIAMDQE